MGIQVAINQRDFQLLIFDSLTRWHFDRHFSAVVNGTTTIIIIIHTGLDICCVKLTQFYNIYVANVIWRDINFLLVDFVHYIILFVIYFCCFEEIVAIFKGI